MVKTDREKPDDLYLDLSHCRRVRLAVGGAMAEVFKPIGEFR